MQRGRIWVQLSFLVECSVFCANQHWPLKHQDLQLVAGWKKYVNFLLDIYPTVAYIHYAGYALGYSSARLVHRSYSANNEQRTKDSNE